MNLTVIGLGYVGLPLSLQFAQSDVRVTGIDLDSEKVESLRQGKSYLRHVPSSLIETCRAQGTFTATTDFSMVRDAEAVVICVPTPLSQHREPDLSHVITSARAIAPYLKTGSLVVLESTTYPGTTDGELRATLENGSGMIAGRDFYLAFSPEREDPGNPSSKVGQIPKVVGGFTPACTEKAMALYSKAIQNLVPVQSSRVAEASKLLENIFRSVNVALVNELKVVYAAMGIDIWEVIEAAKTKPFGFMPFYPGPGLGGHCIPIDPFYLTWKAREFGQHTRFIELAGEINTNMPRFVVERITSALNDHRKPVRGSKILAIGLAYKADVDDMRESPTFPILDQLKDRGAQVAYYDPHIPVITTTREHAAWTGTHSVGWDRDTIASFDAVVICTAHKAIDFSQLHAWASLIVDTRNAMKPFPGPHIYKA